MDFAQAPRNARASYRASYARNLDHKPPRCRPRQRLCVFRPPGRQTKEQRADDLGNVCGEGPELAPWCCRCCRDSFSCPEEPFGVELPSTYFGCSASTFFRTFFKRAKNAPLAQAPRMVGARMAQEGRKKRASRKIRASPAQGKTNWAQGGHFV